MKTRRFAAIILVFCFFGVCFSSCVRGEDVLVLNSKYFQELEAKEIDLQWLKNRHISGETNCYNGPDFVIDEIHGELYLEEREEEFVHYCALADLTFVGFDKGEFGGGAMNVEYNADGEIVSSKVLSQENCLGFLKLREWREPEGVEGYWDESSKECYVFTGIAHMTTDEGRIYKISRSGEDYTFEEFADHGSAPNAFAEDDGELIVATNKSLVSVDADGNITQLFQSDYWKHLYINSMVVLDGCYYFGTSSGILKFVRETKQALWYPYYNKD